MKNECRTHNRDSYRSKPRMESRVSEKDGGSRRTDVKTKKRLEETIYTVVIVENYSETYPDLSTVSFTKLEDAVSYCVSEIGDAYVREELEEDLFYDTGKDKFYIEETRLLGDF